MRHNWPAAFASAGVDLAIQTVSFIQCAADQQLPALLKCITDSSKAPALLSLLLSCLKRLQQSIVHPEAAGVDINKARTASLSWVLPVVQLAAKLIRAAEDSGQAPRVHTNAAGAGLAPSADGSGSHARSCAGSASFTGGAADPTAGPPCPSVSMRPGVTSSLWLLLAGRALCTTGLAMQAATPLDDSTSSSNATIAKPQPHSQQRASCRTTGPGRSKAAAADAAANLPELWLPLLRESIIQLGSALQQLTSSDGAVQGCKQLCIVLDRSALQAYTQLVAACADAVCSACKLACERAAAAHCGCHQAPGTRLAEQGQTQQVGGQLCTTGECQALAGSLISFGSQLCAALPTRLCCNEPSCCCLDRPTELQLAAGKGSKCSACGTARYCGAADQHKHWRQHCPVCKAVAAAAMEATAGTVMDSAKKDKAVHRQQQKRKGA